ncbi:MAG TPA: DNA repair protein RecN [Candidatus Polarisedimenticolia bacterium]|jgi:DNA repair protein RecN (Recombination protein N)|nr:DNA repair protein RecN [Dongiaceae bacterium]HYV89715.1 DNA repair protein RecN [Candidatus Polarisedimenticolia bacterium]
MLLGLVIRDIVLIERLELAFSPGLTVLTGETGAGKSILLDALGLALGARAEAGLLRAGAAQATVTAEFELPKRHPLRALLEEQGLDVEDNLLLRRQLAADGRSRAFLNDQPIGVGLLRQIGDSLVEIVGQFEQHGLLDPSTHGEMLDAHGGHDAPGVALAWKQWQEARQARSTAEAEIAAARRDEEFLRHAADELAGLEPQPGEEAGLAEQRSLMLHRSKLVEAIQAAVEELSGEDGSEQQMNRARRRLDRIADKAQGRLDPATAALDRAQAEIADVIQQLDRLARDLDADPRRLEKIEDRLYALRDLARKHNVPVDDLAALRDRIEAQLTRLDDRSGSLARLTKAEAEARQAYIGVGEALSKARGKTAAKLDKAVMAELAPLKLEKARFVTVVDRLEEPQWGPSGLDRVAFEVATNPGSAPGPIGRIASGGELARFLLALKVVLAAEGSAATLVFDEVDSGIGGATAAAVGERLARLAKSRQLLVVTHSPQVAAQGQHHWRVEKSAGKAGSLTQAGRLDASQRREEIARMLSGATVSEEARAAADRLLGARLV